MTGTQNTITVRALQNDVLDALVNRHLGSTAGHVEATLAANPGLAKVAMDIPMGMPVRLVKAPQPVQDRINLWE